MFSLFFFFFFFQAEDGIRDRSPSRGLGDVYKRQDLYASIDLVVDKLERQIRKFKTKINRKSREKGINAADAAVLFNNEADGNESDSELDIVRTKRLSLKPMDSEEAVLQMNMLGHNFFIFEDADTNGTSIVYRRKDGKYGLIETD